MNRKPPYDKYTSFHANEKAKQEHQENCAQAVKARRIHQVDYKDMDAAKGTIRAVGLGMLAWFTLIAVIIGVMAAIK